MYNGIIVTREIQYAGNNLKNRRIANICIDLGVVLRLDGIMNPLIRKNRITPIRPKSAKSATLFSTMPFEVRDKNQAEEWKKRTKSTAVPRKESIIPSRFSDLIIAFFAVNIDS